MKKLSISIVLLAVLLLAVAGLANAEATQSPDANKPTYHVYGYDKSGELPIYGTICIDQIYGANAKAYQAVLTREDGSVYDTYNISRDAWSAEYTINECGEYTLIVYSCAWPDDVATPTDLLPYESIATPTDLAYYGATDLTPYRIAAGDPFEFQVTSMGPVLPGEDPQVIAGDVPTEVIQGEPLILSPNWGSKGTNASACVYPIVSSGEETDDCLVFDEAYQGQSLYLSTWQLTPGETYRAEVALWSLGFDRVSQNVLFTVLENGQSGIVDEWQWTLTEDLEIDSDTQVRVGAYYPGADNVYISQYINGGIWNGSYGYNGSAFVNVYNYQPGTVTFKAEARVRLEDNTYISIEADCPQKITIKEDIYAPIARLASGYVQRIGEDMVFRFDVTNTEENVDYSGVQYDVNVSYWAGYNSLLVCNMYDQKPNTDITIPWADLSMYGIEDGESLDLTIRAHGQGYRYTWYDQSIYMIGTEDESFIISIDGMDADGHATVYRNEPFNIQVNNVPEGISEIEIIDQNKTWARYSLATTQTCEMKGIGYHTDVPIIARYQTVTGEYRYSNILMLTPVGQGTLASPMVTTNLSEKADDDGLYISRGESIKVRLGNLDDYDTEEIQVRLCARLIKVTGTATTAYEATSCFVQDENTVLRVSTGNMSAEQDDYILKVSVCDGYDRWDESPAVEIPFSMTNDVEEGEIRITLASGDLETQGEDALNLIVGDAYTISVYAPGARRIVLHRSNEYDDFIYIDENMTYVEASDETYSEDRIYYYAEVYYPNENEPIRSNTVTVQVSAPYGNLSDHFSVEIPLIVSRDEPLVVRLRNTDEDNSFVPDFLYVYVNEYMPYLGYYDNICYAEGINTAELTVSTKDERGNSILKNGKNYEVYIIASKRGYNNLYSTNDVFAVASEIQRAVLTINGEDNQADFLTGEEFSISISGLPEGVTAVGVLQPGQYGNWNYFAVPAGETSYSYFSAIGMPVSKSNIIAKYTTQVIGDNLDWSRMNWEGYTNTVDISVSTRGPLPTPVVSTNLTETVEDGEIKLCIEQGNSIMITLDNPEDYAETNNMYLLGSIIKISDGKEIQEENSNCWMGNRDKTMFISTGRLPLQTDDYILRVKMYDYSYMWDQSAVIDIPFSVNANTQIGEIKISASATEVMTGESYIVNVFAPGADTIELYRGNYTSNDIYIIEPSNACSVYPQLHDSQICQYFALVYYPDTNEPIRSEIVTVNVIAPYGELSDHIDISVPRVIAPGEWFAVNLQSIDNNEDLTLDSIYIYVYDEHGYNIGCYGPDLVSGFSTDSWECGKSYRIEISAYKKGYDYLWMQKRVYTFSQDMQHGTLMINNESEQIELQTGESYTVTVSELPAGVTAVSVLIPEYNDEWSYHIITDGTTSLTYNYSINSPVTHAKVLAKYTTQEIDEYPNWDMVTWNGYTNEVDVTAVCTHNETYERYEWDEDSTCSADNNNTHTYTGHAEKWKVCSCCGEKLELLEEITSLTEGHSFNDGVCYACGYACVHDAGDIVHEKYLSGGSTYVNDLMHHVSGTYVEYDYCGHCGKWISEATEIPVDQDEPHHFDENYYCNECGYQSTENHYLNVVCDWENGDTFVALHESKRLCVTSAESDLSDTITYQWYLYDRAIGYVLIENATESYYEIENISDRTEGYVRISDGYTYRDRHFVISIDNGLTAYAENYQNDLTVQPGETVTMNVVAGCNYGELTYQWYEQIDYEEEGNWYTRSDAITDATGASYTSGAITGNKQYYCTVRDEYENSSVVGFYIHIDNGLTAYAENYQNDLTVQPGETVTMNVIASCNYGELTYQWYEQIDYEEEGNWYTRSDAITDATGASYTSGAITGNKQYYCTVRDEYENSSVVGFYIHIDNGLTAYAENNQNDLTVHPGETVTMNVSARCNYGELTYQWYEQIDYEEEGNWYTRSDAIADATGASYTSGAITGYKQYYCTVRDEYENSSDVWFYIHIDNELMINPVGETTRNIVPGDSVILKVDASCIGGGITYEWYEYTYDRENDSWANRIQIEGATGDTYETIALYENKLYTCSIFDEYGNSRSTDFSIKMQNGLKASALYGLTSLSVRYGEPLALKVSASCNNGGLTYQWYEYSRREWNRVKLTGETGTSYTTDCITEYKEYICRVYDECLNYVDVYFYISVDGLTAEPAGDYVFNISEAPITLWVNASSLLFESHITYTWYDPYGYLLDMIEDYGAYTLTNPSVGSYYCDVSDGSQSRRIWFYVVDRAVAQASGNTEYWVSPNEQVTLRVAAWNTQNDITYQWFESDGTVIAGETEAVLLFNANHNRNVYCHVAGTGINTDIPFKVYISNSFQADPDGISKVCLIPSGESVQIIRNITSRYDDNLTFSWFRNGEELPGEASNTLTVTAGGYYVFKAEDCYGNTFEQSFWCVEGEPETVSEWDTVYGKTDTANTICQFIPSEDGIYQFEGNCEIYKAGSEDILISIQWPEIIRLEAGQVYYVVLYNSSNSFRYGLIQKDQEEYSITLQQGQNFRIPDLVINASGYYVYNSISDNQEVVYSNGYYFETLSTGTANLTVNYSCQVQRIYHITVVDASVVTLPDALQTIEEGAFDGDTSIRFIRLGSNVQTVKSGAFANTGDITVIVENSNTVFENGAFTNANPLIICQSDSNVAWYCNGNRIPYLMD